MATNVCGDLKQALIDLRGEDQTARSAAASTLLPFVRDTVKQIAYRSSLDVDDVIQIAMTRIVEAAAHYDDQQAAEPFLAIVSRRAAFTEIKRGKQKSKCPADGILSIDDDRHSDGHALAEIIADPHTRSAADSSIVSALQIIKDAGKSGIKALSLASALKKSKVDRPSKVELLEAGVKASGSGGGTTYSYIG